MIKNIFIIVDYSRLTQTRFTFKFKVTNVLREKFFSEEEREREIITISLRAIIFLF